MTWMDMGLGLCNCGTERRLFRPDGHERDMCSVCATDWAFKRRPRMPEDPPETSRRMPPKYSRNYQAVKARRERNFAAGKCIDCGMLPFMVGKKRCNRCQSTMLGHQRERRAMGAA